MTLIPYNFNPRFKRGLARSSGPSAAYQVQLAGSSAQASADQAQRTKTYQPKQQRTKYKA